MMFIHSCEQHFDTEYVILYRRIETKQRNKVLINYNQFKMTIL